MDYVSLRFLFLSVTISTSILIAEISSQNLKSDAECQRESNGGNLSVENALAEPLLAFSSKLFKAINNETKNIVVSPVAIHSALNIVLLGTGGNSQTRKKLLDVLGYDGNECKADEAQNSYAELMEKFRNISITSNSRQKQQINPKLDIRNVAFLHNANPKPTYLEQISQYYNCTMNKFDENNTTKMMDLIEKVNEWGKDAGFDADLVKFDEIKPKSRDPTAILLNAVQVEASWSTPFGEGWKRAAFYNFGDYKRPVKNSDEEMMALFRSIPHAKYVEFTKGSSRHRKRSEAVAAQNPRSYSDLASLEFKAIGIPLKGNLSFTIFEPLKNGTGKELADLEKSLLSDSSKLRKTLEVLDTTDSNIQTMHMPQFKFSNDVDLISLLESVGLSEAFANLTQISTDHEVKIGQAKHRAVIGLGPHGLKGVKFKFTWSSREINFLHSFNPIQLEIEHPFMFVVRYGKIPMLIGHLVHLGDKTH